ncbi:MAG: Ger(x)C family spore germination protein, partial [Syntrophomonadaceae bacterium]|nr:Ger(x)C family spore germination protein [Syntrophomonadaceae bacterium]
FDKIMVEGKPRFLFTIMSVNPQSGGGGDSGSSSGISEPQKGSNAQIISVSGDTIWTAGRNWAQRSSRRLFLGQAVVAVIGENTAREGIGQIVDFLNRHQDLRERALIIICKGSASDFLNAQPEYEPIASTEINGIIRDSWRRAGKSKYTDLFSVNYDLLTPGKEVLIPYMTLFTPPEASSPIVNASTAPEQESGDQDSGQQDQNSQHPHLQSFVAEGSAVFKGEKMVGLLNDRETQGLLFLTNQIQAGTVSIPTESAEKDVAIRLGASKTKVKPVFKQDGLLLDVSIKAQGDLMEQDSAIVKISKEDFKKVEAAASKEIETRCRKALSMSQELNSDILGLGDRIHRSNPESWKEIKEQWEEIFPLVEANIKVDFTLKQTGVISDPFIIQ